MLARTKLWYLEKTNLRNILTMEERRRIARTAVMLDVPKKVVLYFPKEATHYVYILKEGKVKIYRQTDGKEIILNIINPGELFGELGLAGQQEREEVAEAMEDSVICIINMADMQELMQSMPNLNREVLKLLGNRVTKIQSRLEFLICKNAEQRIRSLIKEIAREHGRVIAGNPEQIEVKLSLSQSDIAKLTATSRQTVSTHLNDLEKQGIIRYDRRRIYIKNFSLF